MHLLEYPYNKTNLERICDSLTNEYGNTRFSSHLKTWAKAKNHIFQLFGGELKVERPVDSFINTDNARSIIEDFLKANTDNNKFTLVESFIRRLLAEGRIQEIIENYLQKDIVFFKTKFNEGMKISRILPRLVPKSLSESIQIEYSKVVQNFSVKGTAVLSIDPIDYITMSENGSGWRSCHSLDGEYRTGTLAYMMDSCSVVAYVTTKKSFVQWGPHEKIFYDDKMWRQMVLINIDSITSYAVQSRQYPNTNRSNAGTISSMLIELLEKNSDRGIKYKFVKESSSELNRIVENVDYDYGDRMWYNDIVQGSFNRGRVIIPVGFVNLNDFFNNMDLDVCWVGVSAIPCACGCNSILRDPNYIFEESREEDDWCDEDEEEEY